jgi:hypothetical protein
LLPEKSRGAEKGAHEGQKMREKGPLTVKMNTLDHACQR